MMTVACSSQDYVVKGFLWDYDFTGYADSSIYFILYQKADPDTNFTVWDTTVVQVKDYDVLEFKPLYNFTHREWYVTAIQHEKTWPDSNWSYESGRSNIVREYFRALPPAGVDSLNGMKAVYIDLGNIQH